MAHQPAPDPTPAEIELAFAANVAWLARFGTVLPRHLVFVGMDVRSLGFADVVAELQRWIADGRLVEDEAGDYRLSPPGLLLDDRIEGIGHVAGVALDAGEVR